MLFCLANAQKSVETYQLLVLCLEALGLPFFSKRATKTPRRYECTIPLQTRKKYHKSIMPVMNRVLKGRDNHTDGHLSLQVL